MDCWCRSTLFPEKQTKKIQKLSEEKENEYKMTLIQWLVPNIPRNGNNGKTNKQTK